MNRYTKNVSFVEIDQPTPFEEEEPETVLWYRLTCSSSGQKVKIRNAPSVSAACLGLLSDGDEVEVYETLQAGFYKLSNRPVSYTSRSHFLLLIYIQNNMYLCLYIFNIRVSLINTHSEWNGQKWKLLAVKQIRRLQGMR